jgi:hypothetical protein
MKLLLFFLVTYQISFAQSNSPVLTFIDEYRIENKMNYEHTTVGGLSGIDYVSDSIFYIISDDPGAHGAPRFYKVSISYAQSVGIKELKFLAVNYLKPPAHKSFGAAIDLVDTSKYSYSDGEAIRYDKSTDQLFWSSEGYKYNRIVSQPFIFKATSKGAFIRKITSDPLFLFNLSTEKGAQPNSVFEALAFVPGTDNFVYCSEKSLLQDANSDDSIQPVRITVANKLTGKTLTQFAYPLPNVFNNNSNGVVELLALSADSFLVLERAYDKHAGNVVRLYLASVNHKATDVKTESMLKGKTYNFLKKELLLDFSKSGVKHVDNIEGMTWGYPLGENKKAILFVSDNNFSDKQVTQLLLFKYTY